MSMSRAFEVFVRQVRPVLVQHHGEALAEKIEAATRVEYERVRPQVPDIGGLANVFQPVMIANGWIVALYRGMAGQGLAALDAARACQEALDIWFRKAPAWLLRGIGRALLSPPARWFFERQAGRSQKRRYAEDFVWSLENGPGGELSMIFEECAVNKWYETQGVPELAPFCNFADVTYSRLMGMGIDASETIGQGCDRCALRYKRGRPTAIPSNLEAIVRAEP